MERGPVVVTGASGYIGSHIVANLLSKGMRVRATVRDLEDPERVAHLKSMDIAEGGDIEIVEMHHRRKIDAPSGTALSLLGTVRSQLSQEASLVDGRSGLVGPRSEGEIGIHAIRGGDVVGEHSVIFALEGERVELTHRASTRTNFAQGAVAAAKWLSTQPSAGLYGMEHLIANLAA